MTAARILRSARLRAALSLREVATRAATSQPTLTAYEKGRVSPGVATLDRILTACGYSATVRLQRRERHGPAEGLTRGEELASVLDLAEQFPARHDATLIAPVFGR